MGTPQGPRTLRNAATAAIFALAGASAAEASAAITAAQAKTAIEAYNTVYWRASNKTFYKFDNRTGELDYWMWAHAWEVQMDAYERTRDPAYLQKIRDVYDGFVAKFGTDLRDRDFNDDIAWWVLAATRAYDLTQVQAYRDLAKRNFDWVLSTQADTVFGGGLWWMNVNRNQKNAATNLPFAVSGFKLARQLKDSTYAAKARGLHAWMRRRLYRDYGEVADRIQKVNGRDSVFWGPLSYNHGTWVSSSWEMFRATGDSLYFKDALQSLNYFRDILCAKTTQIMPDERGDGTGNTDNDAGMYKTVFVHYAMRFIIEAKQWQYLPWMNANAESLWKNRRTADNLMYFAWSTPTPTQAGRVGAQMASGGVALLNLMVLADSLARPIPTAARPAAAAAAPAAFTLAVSGGAASYTLPRAGRLTLELRDPSGRLLRSLPPVAQPAGTHTLVLPAEMAGKGGGILRAEFRGEGPGTGRAAAAVPLR